MADEPRQFTKQEICSQFTPGTGRNQDDARKALTWILSELNIHESQVDEQKVKHLLKRLSALKSKFDSKYIKCSYNKTRFEAKHGPWLDGQFLIDYPLVREEPVTGTSSEDGSDSDVSESDPPQRCRRYTPDEALDLISELALTKRQYIAIRSMCLTKNVDLYPSYAEVMEAKAARQRGAAA